MIKHERNTTMMQGRMFNCMMVLDDAVGTTVQGRSDVSAEDARVKALAKANARFVSEALFAEQQAYLENEQRDAVALSLAESEAQS